MSVRLPSLKTLAITLASLVAVYLLFAWLALPRIIQAQAESYLAEKTGHRLSLDRPEFNPFEMRLRVANLRLAEPAGKPLFGFRELVVDLSAASIFRRAWVFDRIRLDEPEATVVLQADGRLNWSPLIEALRGKDERSAAPLPRLDIRSFTLAGGKVEFADKRADFATLIQRLDLELSDISTLPDDQGRYQVSARTSLGARVQWQGEATLNPLVVSGTLGIESLDLATLAPYLKNVLTVAPPAGSASLSTGYRLAYAGGRLDLSLDQLNATLTGARLKIAHPLAADIAVDAIEVRDGRFDLARMSLTLGSLRFKDNRVDLRRPAGGPIKLLQSGSLALEDARLDLAGRDLSVGRIALKDGRLRLARDAQGRLDALAAWQSAPQSTAAAKPAQATVAPGWRYRVHKLEVSGFSASLRDESVAPAAELALEDIAFDVDGISDDFAAGLPIRASFRAHDGGSFEAAGRIVPAEPAADLKFKLADWSLKPAQPYLSAQTALTLASGLLAVDGHAVHGKRGSSFKGSVSVRDLRLDESATGELFLSWKSLGSRDLEATAAKLEIRELSLDGVDTKVVIHKDKSVNVGSMLRKKTADAGAEKVTAASAAAAADSPRRAPSLLVNVDRLRVSNGEMDFEDRSLTLPFGTRIHHLRGAVIGLSSRPGSPGQVELEGQVDDYGLARAVGQMDFFNPTEFTDLKVIFRNVEMTRLTPYSATFAGRKIDSGKLSLDLEYKINKRQLAGENQVIMDQLTLGQRVDSPDARNLPLDLAIALLQDSEGRIDLGLPVSGSLDDPQFSYGALIWKAIVNIVGKIATAPFRALGALLGGGEKIESIVFETGDAQLTPPEREKLLRLSAALNKRPGLSLTLHGAYAEPDRISLRERQLRRTLALRAGQRLEGQEHAGPLSTRSPGIQAALEGLYNERVGTTELAALKEGFRQANPGQLEQGAAGRMMSRLSGLIPQNQGRALVREEKALGAQEVATLKGTDFHAVLFERLRERETVAEAQLLALARARGENTLASLKAAGAPPERLMLGSPEKVNSEGREVPLKLVLGAVPKPAGPAATSN